MLSSKNRQRMYNSLLPKYGDREANNIVDYYADAMTDRSESEVSADTERLLSDEPVQYVCNTSFFYGHRLYVDNNVLIPRPETEELVHWIITDVKDRKVDILDIGTGSGCILLNVLYKCQNATGTGVDIEEEVAKVFDKNASILDVNAKFQQLDILDKEQITSLQKYDVIVSNPPYILHSEKNRMGESVIKYEPDVALYVEDTNPLLFYKRIKAIGEGHLSPGGSIYFETSDLYHDELLDYVQKSEFQFEFRKDLQGEFRMLKLWRS